MRKLVLIIGGFLGLLTLLVLARSVGKDQLKPQLDTIVAANYKLINLSLDAADNLSDYNLQIAAANLTNVVISNNVSLAAYYQQRYHKKLPAAPKDFTELDQLKLAASGQAYDDQYRSAVHDLLTNNINVIKQTETATSRSDLKQLLINLEANQTALLSALP